MHNLFNELHLPQLRARTSAKWQKYGGEVVPMWVAEMDVPIAKEVTVAVTQALNIGDTGYPFMNSYQDAFREFAAQTWNWEVAHTNTRITTDVMGGVQQILALHTEKGDRVAVSAPVYPPFYSYPQDLGLQVVSSPLTAEGRIDLENLAEVFKDVKAYLLCNPHNPTGVIPSQGELLELLRLANANGVVIISDEIHAPLVDPGQFTPIMALPGSAAAYSLHSASKGWNLAGLKAALIVSGEKSQKTLRNSPPSAGSGASHLALIAQSAAYNNARPWLYAVRESIKENQQYFQEQLKEHLPDAISVLPQATYLTWVDFTQVRTASGKGLGADPARFFLEYAKVAFNHGPTFGLGGEGKLRVNIATNQAIISQAVTQLRLALENN